MLDTLPSIRMAKNKSTLVDIAAKESAGALEAQKKGQNIGLAISLVCVLCAIVCALMDNDRDMRVLGCPDSIAHWLIHAKTVEQ